MLNFFSNLGPFLSNPWVVGIGGSTLSGLIVWWVTQRLFSTKENKEYIQKVLSANTEVLYALRPLISESAFPSSVIVDSVISATARKFNIKKESMNTAMQFFDELIKEVMDSNFIAPKKKIEYCKHLHELKVEALSLTQPRAATTDLDASAIVRREKMFNALSVSIAFMVGITILLLTLSNASDRSPFTNVFGSIFVPVVAAIVTSLFALVVSMFSRDEDGGDFFERLTTLLGTKVDDKDKKI